MLQSTNDVKQKIQKTIVSQHQEITISLLTHPLFFCKILLLLLFYLSIFIDRHLLRCLCCHIAFVFCKTRYRYCPYLCFYGSFLLSWMLRSPNEAKQNIQDAKWCPHHNTKANPQNMLVCGRKTKNPTNLLNFHNNSPCGKGAMNVLATVKTSFFSWRHQNKQTDLMETKPIVELHTF